VNVPLSLVSEGGRLRTPDELRALFAQAGVKPGQPAITYCHIGQQATLLWFVARELGYEVKMFDGSFQQWSGTSLPLGTP
jgi:thiosulfate/3-mercaptopyruvate sulfurtransferase